MKTKTQVKTSSREARHKRIRARVIGTSEKPRLSIYKSNTAIYAQLIDDSANKTLVAADTRKLKGDSVVARATVLGETIAKLAQDKGVTTIVFDRGGFRYQGAVAAVAEGARSGGLKF